MAEATADPPQEGKNAKDKPKPKDPLAGLAGLWEQDEVLRRHLLSSNSLLAWPTKKLVGVISFETMASNTRVLQILLGLWCPTVPAAQTVRIDNVRDQASCNVAVGALVIAASCRSRFNFCVHP